MSTSSVAPMSFSKVAVAGSRPADPPRVLVVPDGRLRRDQFEAARKSAYWMGGSYFEADAKQRGFIFSSERIADIFLRSQGEKPAEPTHPTASGPLRAQPESGVDGRSPSPRPVAMSEGAAVPVVEGIRPIDPAAVVVGQPQTRQPDYTAAATGEPKPSVAHGAPQPGILTAADERHADAIAAWMVVLDVNSNGGQGISLKSERPAVVAFPDMLSRYVEAKESLGWDYRRLPFDIAKRMSSIPSEAAWSAKRALSDNPPLMPTERAMALHQRITMQRTGYGSLVVGYGNAAAAKVIAAYLAADPVIEGNRPIAPVAAVAVDQPQTRQPDDTAAATGEPQGPRQPTAPDSVIAPGPIATSPTHAPASVPASLPAPAEALTALDCVDHAMIERERAAKAAGMDTLRVHLMRTEPGDLVCDGTARHVGMFKLYREAESVAKQFDGAKVGIGSRVKRDGQLATDLHWVYIKGPPGAAPAISRSEVKDRFATLMANASFAPVDRRAMADSLEAQSLGKASASPPPSGVAGQGMAAEGSPDEVRPEVRPMPSHEGKAEPPDAEKAENDGGSSPATEARAGESPTPGNEAMAPERLEGFARDLERTGVVYDPGHSRSVMMLQHPDGVQWTFTVTPPKGSRMYPLTAEERVRGWATLEEARAGAMEAVRDPAWKPGPEKPAATAEAERAARHQVVEDILSTEWGSLAKPSEYELTKAATDRKHVEDWRQHVGRLQRWCADADAKLSHPRRNHLNSSNIEFLRTNSREKQAEIGATTKRIHEREKEVKLVEWRTMIFDKTANPEDRLVALESLNDEVRKGEAAHSLSQRTYGVVKGWAVKDAMAHGADEELAGRVALEAWSTVRWHGRNQRPDGPTLAYSVAERLHAHRQQAKAAQEKAAREEAERVAKEAAAAQARAWIEAGTRYLSLSEGSGSLKKSGLDYSNMMVAGSTYLTDGKIVVRRSAVKGKQALAQAQHSTKQGGCDDANLERAIGYSGNPMEARLIGLVQCPDAPPSKEGKRPTAGPCYGLVELKEGGKTTYDVYNGHYLSFIEQHVPYSRVERRRGLTFLKDDQVVAFLMPTTFHDMPQVERWAERLERRPTT